MVATGGSTVFIYLFIYLFITVYIYLLHWFKEANGRTTSDDLKK